MNKRYKGDVKNNNIYPYNRSFFQSRPGVQPDGTSQLLIIASFILAGIAFFFKLKWAVWCSLYAIVFSIMNSKFESDIKQTLTSFTIVLTGFVTVYVAPDRNRLPQQTG